MLNTEDLFTWSVDSEGATYSVKFTEEGKQFMASMIFYTVDESNFNFTMNDIFNFLYDFENTSAINDFEPTDDFKFATIRIINAFYDYEIQGLKDCTYHAWQSIKPYYNYERENY